MKWRFKDMKVLTEEQKESLNLRIKMIEQRMKEKGYYVFITGALWALIFMFFMIEAAVYLYKTDYILFCFITVFLSSCCFMSFLCKVLQHLLYYMYKTYKKLDGKDF
jgi:hypothetical protein